MNESLRGREAAIECAILKAPESLGYRGAKVIRNCRVPSIVGFPDLILLPDTGQHRFVLVEAKAAAAEEAASKVVGQLLMYYTGALTLGESGLGF